MSTEKTLDSLVLNRVKSQEVFDSMMAQGLIKDDELYLIEGESGYTLPPASATLLGGIKVGSNIHVTTDGTISIPDGTTTTKGVVMLVHSVSSADTTKAATAASVKQAYDLANSKASKSDIPTKTSQLDNDSGFLTTHQDISSKLDKTGDASNATTSFTQASTRLNLSTGEKLSVTMGKIMKWFSDLGSMAFKSVVSKSDLASEVQASLDKADTAIQSLDGYVTQDYVDGIKAVSYGTAQTLTDEQQAQARDNMDAQQRPFTYELGDPVAENVEIAAGETYTISTPVDLIKNDQYFLSLCDASDVRYDILGTAYPYTVNDSAITVRWLDGYVVYDGTHIENHYPWAIHDVTIQKVLSWSLAPSEQILSLEGKETSASGLYAHAEGANTIASGSRSHAEGSDSVASGKKSHAEGNSTIAASDNQHVQGKFNVADAGKTYAHIVGNGTAEADRSNAHTLDWSGNAWYAGDVYVGGTGQNDTAAKKLGVETIYIQAYTSNSTWALNGGYTYADVKALIDDNNPPIIYIKFSDNSRRDYHYDYINSSGTIYFIAPYGNYLYVYTIKSDGTMSSIYYSLVTTSRTINGHALSANITLTSDDVKAVSYDTAQTLSDDQKVQARENICAQGVLTFDSTPIADSTNPVTSGGVYAALASYTETDPTVPDWAKAATKPSYTASEVGAISSELKDNYDAAYAHSQAPHAPSNAEQNVQSDWNVTDANSDAYIKNKPDVATQADLSAIEAVLTSV